MERYEILRLVGKGACGNVYLVRHKEQKRLTALKKIQLDESKKSRTRQAVLKEANILSRLKHPNIVAYYESFFDENEEFLCIVQDYCDGGTLDDRIQEAATKNQYFPEKQIMQWIIQITMAVQHIHSKKVLHRDLKSQNVFMTKNGNTCKLGDFGISKMMDHTFDMASTLVGTPCYLSPELCQDIPYSSKSDIWAVGCLLYEMCALKPAFDAQNLVSLFYKIVKGEYQTVPECFSAELKSVIDALLCTCPEKRPSARGILCLPYIKEELWHFIEEKENLIAKRQLEKESVELLTYMKHPTSANSKERCKSEEPDSSVINQDDDTDKRPSSCTPKLLSAPQPGASSSQQSSRVYQSLTTRVLSSSHPASIRLDLTNCCHDSGDSINESTEQSAREGNTVHSSSEEGSLKTNCNQSSTPHVESLSLPLSPTSKTEAFKKLAKNPLNATNKSKQNIVTSKASRVTLPQHVRRNSEPMQQVNIIPSVTTTPKSPNKTPRGHDKKQETSSAVSKTSPLYSKDLNKSLQKSLSHKNNNVTGNAGSKVSPTRSKPGTWETQTLTPHTLTSRIPFYSRKTKDTTIKLPALKNNGKVGLLGTPRVPQNTASQPGVVIRKKSFRKNAGDDSGEYSDDFDENSSDSDIDEALRRYEQDLDIPEELAEGSLDMFTADESGEIPEEISLSEASDQEAEEEILEFDDPIDPESLAPGGIFEYDDDFEDYDSEEELDRLVSMAKEAHDEISASEEDLVIDNGAIQGIRARKFIKQHCVSVLGKEKFERVRLHLEGNHTASPAALRGYFRTLVGEDLVETCFLLQEMQNNK